MKLFKKRERKEKIKKEKVVKEKKKWSFKKKCAVTLTSLFVVGVAGFLFIFYGPWAGFRNFWITSAMTTMSHQYLAKIFYSDKAIGIDGGCGYPKSQFFGETIGRLACIRLDDMKVFYSAEEGIENN